MTDQLNNSNIVVSVCSSQVPNLSLPAKFPLFSRKFVSKINESVFVL